MSSHSVSSISIIVIVFGWLVFQCVDDDPCLVDEFIFDIAGLDSLQFFGVEDHNGIAFVTKGFKGSSFFAGDD